MKAASYAVCKLVGDPGYVVVSHYATSDASQCECDPCSRVEAVALALALAHAAHVPAEV